MRSLLVSAVVLALATSAFAQTPPAAKPTPAAPARPPAPVTPPAAPAQPAATAPMPTVTEILWDDEAALLKGDHPVAWQRLIKRGGKRGSVMVSDDKGLWRVSGKQTGSTPETTDDYVAIDGVIVAITSGVFTLRGDVTYRSAAISGGNACKSSGEHRFLRRPGEQVWRLQNARNACNNDIEILDVTFRPDQARAVASEKGAKGAPPPPKVAPVSKTGQ